MNHISLNTKLIDFLKLSKDQKEGLKKIQIETIRDILWYFPVRYGDTAESGHTNNLQKGQKVTLFGQISKLKTEKGFRSKIPMSKAVLTDDTGSINLIWFNQPYIAKMLKEDSFVKAEGTISERNGKFALTNPHIETLTKLPTITGDSIFGVEGESFTLYPVYRETRYITSNWIYHTIQKIFKQNFFETIEDIIPKEILSTYHLPSLKTALIWIHSPQNKNHATASRKRFAFEEIFLIQLQKELDRQENNKLKAETLLHTKKDVDAFISRFNFSLTTSQEEAIKNILSDFEKGTPMARLLHGDVGSGKTAVAATTAFAVTQNHPNQKDFGNFQVAYMAPTEILATQHFESFISFFKHLPVQIALITGSVCKKFPSKTNPDQATTISKSQLLKWVQDGEISILIGTHALIQKKVQFKNLAYVIIDEQHRFGTKQRKELARKDGLVPHLLSMSATPIPRTLALTLYGDLDISLLDQMPSGRKKVITNIITPNKREEAYEEIRGQLELGRQLYVICPRIDEPDLDKAKSLNVKSVKEEAKRLKEKVFQGYSIDILHSKMTPKEKENVMQKFQDKKIDILVATSVVEVGVNVVNATMIIIEGAERFGLSQLHQLRGRVMRGDHQPYCYIFADSKTEKTTERLRAFVNAKDGFELAELDLKLRGIGELSGTKQWGISDIAMEAIQNLKLVEAARTEAKNIISSSNLPKKYPLLLKAIQEKELTHFE